MGFIFLEDRTGGGTLWEKKRMNIREGAKRNSSEVDLLNRKREPREATTQDSEET